MNSEDESIEEEQEEEYEEAGDFFGAVHKYNRAKNKLFIRQPP